MEERRKGDRRTGERRQLYGKPFLAMLIGGLPEDRRKGERRNAEGRGRRASDGIAS